ncbi:MAG: hypothetical protein LLF94_05685 [Chlamydiales bacterium]|nr:hypothetical protein [Chlamydiales bacterium]
MRLIKAIILLVIIVPTLAFTQNFDDLVEDHIKAHSKFKKSSKLIKTLNKTNRDKKEQYLKQIELALESFQKTVKYYDKVIKGFSKEISENRDDNDAYSDREYDELITIQQTMQAEKQVCQNTIDNLTNTLLAEKALSLKSEALKKFEEANNYPFPAKTIANELEYLQGFQEAQKLYAEAIQTLWDATIYLSPSKHESLKDSFLKDIGVIKQIVAQQNEQKNTWQNALNAQKDTLRKKIEPLEKEFQACKKNGLKRIAFEVNNELLEILTLLSKTQNDLQAKKAACTAFKAAFLKEADSKRFTQTPWSDVKETKAEEDRRRAIFYANNALYQAQTPLITQSTGDLCVTPIDSQRKSAFTDYVMQTNTTYRFALQHVDDISDIYVKIFEGATEIHEIKIPLPKPNSFSWNYYVLQEGFIHTTETELLNDYGLDLSLRLYYDEDFKTNIIISQKAASTKFTFTIDCGQNCLAYKSIYVDPLPHQLDALHKPALWTASKSIDTNLQMGIAAVQSLTTQTEHKIPLLDDLVTQLKADPLAIATYVHNEITNDHFSVYFDQILYKATPINRHAAMVFLEKRGSPWEQCQLLLYLLKKAGYDAQYVSDALVLFEKSKFENLFFLTIDTFNNTIPALLPGVTFFYNNEWITLYPWMKDVEIIEGHNLYQFFPKDYASGEKWVSQYLKNDENILKHIGSDSDDTVGVLFGLFATDELRKQGLTLDDVGLSCKTIKKQFANWSDFPRPHISNSPKTFAVADKNSGLFTKACIEIKSHSNPNKVISYSFALADLYCDALTIECKDQLKKEKKSKKSKKKKKHAAKETDVNTIFR